MKYSIFLFLIFLTFMAHSETPEADIALNDPVEEMRAVRIGAELRCIVCQSQSVNDSEALLAHDIRQLIREKIAAGWSDEKIIAFIRDRYGDFILLKPPLQRNTWVLWLCPLFFAVAALGVFFSCLRHRSQGRRQS